MDYDTLAAKADGVFNSGDMANSRTLYLKLCASGKHKPHALFGLGAIAVRTGNLSEARSKLDACLEAEPRAANAHLLLGSIEEAARDWAAATRHYEKALQLNPQLAEASVRLAALRSTARQIADEPSQSNPLRDNVAITPAVSRSTQTELPTFGETSMGQAKGWIRGKVSAYQTRFEGSAHGQIFIWNFRLVVEDSRPPLPVEMRGLTFSGTISNGDIVEVPKKASNGGMIKTDRLRNISAGGSDVTCYYPYEAHSNQRSWVWGGRLVGWTFLIIFVGIFLKVVTLMH